MTSATAPHEHEHMLDIQGLRAVAVLVVIADHAGAEWLPGGFIGVDVFFVISGYLITLLICREVDANGAVKIGEFYARRARRILPAATLVILAIMAYAAQELSLSQVQRLKDDATWSALFAANIHFSSIGTDYFARGRDPSPFQHYWSLAVEEQFYLVWPVLVALVVFVTVRRSGSTAAAMQTVSGLLVTIIFVSLAWSVWITDVAPGTAYYSSVGRAWELAIGALLAVHRPRIAALPRRARTWLSTVGLAAILGSAIGYNAHSLFPGWRALLPVVGTAAIVAAGVNGSSVVSRLLGLAPLTWVGDRSYSLYLWHWPLLVLGAAHPGLPAGAAGTTVLLSLTVLASALTYHFVENPFRRARLLRRGRWALVLWPVAVSLVLVVVTQSERRAAVMFEERIARSGAGHALPSAATPPPKRQEGEHQRPGSVAGQTLSDRMSAALRAADSGDPVPFPLVNLPQAPKDVFALGPDCVVDPPETSTRVCPLGHASASTTMAVFGDSQAGQWLPAISRLAERNGIRVLPLIKLGCPPFNVPVVDGGLADFWQCTEFREWATGYIAKKRPELIVIASEATSHRRRTSPGLDLAETWAEGVKGTLQQLEPLGSRIVVLADTPDLDFDPVDCLTAPNARLHDCIGVPHHGLEAANVITRSAATATGAGYIDTVDLLCVDGRCPLVVDRTMTFMDYSHVSAAWSAALADDFERLYVTALPGGSSARFMGSPRSKVPETWSAD